MTILKLKNSLAVLLGAVSAIFAVTIWYQNIEVEKAVAPLANTLAFSPFPFALLLLIACPVVISLPSIITKTETDKNYYLSLFISSVIFTIVGMTLIILWGLRNILVV